MTLSDPTDDENVTHLRALLNRIAGGSPPQEEPLADAEEERRRRRERRRARRNRRRPISPAPTQPIDGDAASRFGFYDFIYLSGRGRHA